MPQLFGKIDKSAAIVLFSMPTAEEWIEIAMKRARSGQPWDDVESAIGMAVKINPAVEGLDEVEHVNGSVEAKISENIDYWLSECCRRADMKESWDKVGLALIMAYRCAKEIGKEITTDITKFDEKYKYELADLLGIDLTPITPLYTA